MAGTWSPLGHQPPVAIDTMLLLTDGSVMCHEYEAAGSITPNWYRLVPDAFMNYANGTWHKLTPMPSNAPVGQNGPWMRLSISLPRFCGTVASSLPAANTTSAAERVSIFLPVPSTIPWLIHGHRFPRRRDGAISAMRQPAYCPTEKC